jgi:hypothetical protein
VEFISAEVRARVRVRVSNKVRIRFQVKRREWGSISRVRVRRYG